MKKLVNVHIDPVIWKKLQHIAVDDELKPKNWIEKLIETTVNERSKL